MANGIDYLDCIKRALTATWRHKGLWLFGFFVALGGGGGGNWSSNTRGFSSGSSEMRGRLADIDWASLLPIIIAVLVMGFVVWLVLFVMRLISQGALVSMARDIERGASPGVADGFKAGSGFWLRILGVELVLAIPLVLVVMLIAGVAVLLAFGAGAFGTLAQRGGETAAATGVLGTVCGVLALIGVALVVLIPLVVVVSVLMDLSRRYVVLFDQGVFAAVGSGWRTFRGRFKDVALMWLLMLVVGLIVGLATAFAGLALVGPGIALMIFNPLAGIILLLPGLLVLFFLSGVIAAFQSVAWTNFFLALEPSAA